MADEENHVSETPKKKKKNWFVRHKILTGLIVLIIIIIASNAGKSDNSKNTQSTSNASDSTAQPKKNTAEKPKDSKIGDAIRDGKFEFTVNSQKCGETSVGSQYINTKAQGVFCRVNVQVKNIGNEAQTLDSTSQYAYNSSGQKYSTDSTAAIYANSDSNNTSAWYDDINPGNTVKGDLFFDVPKGTKLTKIELHDSSLSNGVTVSLQ